MYKPGIAMAILLTGLFLLMAGGVFSQEADTADETIQRSSIPQELLRPRRNEAPRYPIDTVIGELGQGKASQEAYRFARRVAAALLEGNTSAPSLSAANAIFVDGWINALNFVSPKFFRMGNGRQEPDGSYSFLIRFIGREEAVTGELFVRYVEKRAPVPEIPPPAQAPAEAGQEGAEAETVQAPPPPPPPPVERFWAFEELILEEPRSREAENNETRHRYDFSPYERFF